MQILDLRALVWEIIGNIRAATASVSGCTAAPEVGYQPNVSANVSDLIYDWNTIYARSMVPSGRVLLNDESLRDGLQSPSVRDPSIEEKIEILDLMVAIG